MSNLADERRGELAAQLWRHKMARPEGEPMTWCVCLCWSTARGALADDERAHNAHVADALAPMLAGWLAEAEQQAAYWEGEYDDASAKYDAQYQRGQRDLAAKVEALLSEPGYGINTLRSDLRALLADALAGNGAEEPSSVPVSAREGGNGQDHAGEGERSADRPTAAREDLPAWTACDGHPCRFCVDDA